MTEHRRPVKSSSDAGAYLEQYGDLGRAVTKAEHDAHVANTGRPFTDPGYRTPRKPASRADLGHLTYTDPLTGGADNR